MGANSKIEWTEATWNPVAGCAIVSPGCTNCYAMRMAARLEHMGQEKYSGLTRRSAGRPKWNGEVRLDHEALSLPYSWKVGRMIFVNSMSDLFQERVPFEFVRSVFKIMRDCRQHTFQVLTKRTDRLRDIAGDLEWAPNIWMGVSVENSDYRYRIDDLRIAPASVRFLSLEPLIGDVGLLNLSGIDWVIAGGESGPGARPMNPAWVRSIRDQCVSANVPFHFKQWGGVNKKRSGRILDGRTWEQFPAPAVA